MTKKKELKKYILTKTSDNSTISEKSIKEYAEFLYEENKLKNTNLTEFVLKSCNLQKLYKNKFWLNDSKIAFELLLNEIIQNKFKIEDIYYVMTSAKIMEGFEKYIIEFIEKKGYKKEVEEKRLKKLAKQKELDELILMFINKELLKETNTTKEKI